MTAVSAPYPLFSGLDNRLLDNGYVWFGLENMDPETNPAPVFSDAAMTIPLLQPLRTKSGVLSANDAPIQVYINGAYSIRVRNSALAVVYYRPSVVSEVSTNAKASLAELRASDIAEIAVIYDGSIWTWTAGNFSSKLDNVTVVKADTIPITEGAWVREGENFGFASDVRVGVEIDQAPAINSLLANGNISYVTLPSGVIWINQAIVVPANKTLLLQTGTIIRAMTTFANVSGRNAGVWLNGNRAAIENGTVDMNKVGLGAGAGARKNGVVVPDGVRDARRRNILIINCTGYGSYDAGVDLSTTPPSSYSENVTCLNCQVCHEWQAADGSVSINPRAGNGDGDIPIESFFHPNAGTKNLRLVGPVAKGAASAGIDLFGNVAQLQEIYIDKPAIEMTGNTVALACSMSAFGLKGLYVDGGKLKTPYIASALVNVNAGKFVGTVFEGVTAIEYTSDYDLDCTGCQFSGGTNPGGGAIGYGIISYGTGAIRWNGGIITVTGPAGSATGNGNVRISADTKQTPVSTTILNKRQEYAAQLAPITDGVNCYANFTVPLNPADLTKVTCKVGVRSLTGGYVDVYGASWRYNGSANSFRAQLGNRVLVPANHVFDVHFIEFF